MFYSRGAKLKRKKEERRREGEKEGGEGEKLSADSLKLHCLAKVRAHSQVTVHHHGVVVREGVAIRVVWERVELLHGVLGPRDARVHARRARRVAGGAVIGRGVREAMPLLQRLGFVVHVKVLATAVREQHVLRREVLLAGRHVVLLAAVPDLVELRRGIRRHDGVWDGRLHRNSHVLRVADEIPQRAHGELGEVAPGQLLVAGNPGVRQDALGVQALLRRAEQAADEVLDVR
mmetsp:Transcript_5882/g.18912  ORF Transcript_5882/g.18912 Transcript_5882/m.18912 type:complete len:233 (-) Transcript_5882:865-1563(-)